MKIPKHIDEALRKRTQAANQFNKYDFIISEWIDKHNLDDEIDSSCFHSGVEAVVNPEAAEEEIRYAIIAKGDVL